MNKSCKQPSIAVLVLNYRTWDTAIDCVNRAFALEGDSISEYILFDDGSEVDTMPRALADPRIKIIYGKVNRGFTRALNAAFKATTADVIVLFDSDAYPVRAFANIVRTQFACEPRLGVLGFHSLRKDGTPSESFHGLPGTLSLLLGQAIYSRCQSFLENPGQLCVFTCCMASRRLAWEQIGGFDENFDLLDVDLDYSIRMSRSGWLVRTEARLLAVHEGGGSPQTQRTRVMRFYKNRWYFLRKHGMVRRPGPYRALIVWRLRLEWFLLKCFGGLIFRNTATIADKICGRSELIAICKETFR